MKKVFKRTEIKKVFQRKVKGDNVFSVWIDEYCKCGCRLRYDRYNKLVYCSGVDCTFYRREEISDARQ